MSVKKKRALDTIKIENILYVEASRYDELRTAVFAMLAVLSKGVFDPGEYFDHDVRVMRAKEFSAASKAVEELL